MVSGIHKVGNRVILVNSSLLDLDNISSIDIGAEVAGGRSRDGASESSSTKHGGGTRNLEITSSIKSSEKQPPTHIEVARHELYTHYSNFFNSLLFSLHKQGGFERRIYIDMENDEDIVEEYLDSNYVVKESMDGEASEIVSLKHEGAFVMYHVIYETNIMDIQHVYVPKEHRHQGVAAGLVKKVLSLASQNNWRVVPTCTYVRDTFFLKYPELYMKHCA